jgi:hypothetical protein
MPTPPPEAACQTTAGVATVVFHSVLMSYLREEACERTAENATLAWLSMAPAGDEATSTKIPLYSESWRNTAKVLSFGRRTFVVLTVTGG